MRKFSCFASLALLLACGAKTSRDLGETCIRDEDCAGEGYCALKSPTAQLPESFEPRTNPSGGAAGAPVAPPLCDCTGDEDCPGGVCEKGVIRELLGLGWGSCTDSSGDANSGNCTAACSEGSCPDGFTCGESGHCEITTCADLPAAPCPENWECEPAEASSPASFTLEHRKLAEQGCIPVGCDTSGSCAEDTHWICQPERSTEGLPLDPHGCVPRTCLEGIECGAGYRCRETQIALDGLGCVLLQCDEEGGHTCPAPLECAPSSPLADDYGCISSENNPGDSSGTGGAAGESRAGTCQARQ